MGSTGLGLNMVARHTSAAGGRLHTGPGVLGGALIRLELPLWRPDAIPGRRSTRTTRRRRWRRQIRPGRPAG